MPINVNTFFTNDFMISMLLIVGALIVTGIAQARVKSTYKTYSAVASKSGVTGAEFARIMLKQNGITDVAVNQTQGFLTDHYDPKSNTVNLSEEVYKKSSIASIAIAAHEIGHVIQKYKGYAPMKVRTAIVPVVNVVSKLALPLIILSIFIGFPQIAVYGAWAYFAIVIFQLVTLPVEFNASARALENIKSSNVLDASEQPEAKKVLGAAAMTYVAGLVATFLSFLRLLLIARRR